MKYSLIGFASKYQNIFCYPSEFASFNFNTPQAFLGISLFGFVGKIWHVNCLVLNFITIPQITLGRRINVPELRFLRQFTILCYLNWKLFRNCILFDRSKNPSKEQLEYGCYMKIYFQGFRVEPSHRADGVTTM